MLNRPWVEATGLQVSEAENAAVELRILSKRFYVQWRSRLVGDFY